MFFVSSRAWGKEKILSLHRIPRSDALWLSHRSFVVSQVFCAATVCDFRSVIYVTLIRKECGIWRSEVRFLIRTHWHFFFLHCLTLVTRRKKALNYYAPKMTVFDHQVSTSKTQLVPRSGFYEALWANFGQFISDLGLMKARSHSNLPLYRLRLYI